MFLLDTQQRTCLCVGFMWCSVAMIVNGAGMFRYEGLSGTGRFDGEPGTNHVGTR